MFERARDREGFHSLRGASDWSERRAARRRCGVDGRTGREDCEDLVSLNFGKLEEYILLKFSREVRKAWVFLLDFGGRGIPWKTFDPSLLGIGAYFFRVRLWTNVVFRSCVECRSS